MDELNTQTSNFLALLGRLVNPEAAGSLSAPVDWTEIFRLAGEHNVSALIFDTASELPEFLACPAYSSYMAEAMEQVVYQARQTDAFLELYRAFSENGLYPIVMKGIVCRQLYGEYCDHRPSGDEDILIRKEDFELAERILKEQGYFHEHSQITLKELEELQEVTFLNAETQLVIELHINPFGHENHLRRRMNDLFRNVFENYREIEVNGTVLHTMNHTDHFLFLILHVFRHWTASGFGIRQALDILLYEKQFGEEIDREYIRAALEDIGAVEFLTDLICIGNQYLAFSLPVFGKPNCPEELLDDIMHSGAFGNSTQAQRTAVHMTSAAISPSKHRGKAAVLWLAIFPSRAQLLSLHPELQRKPWLLPVRWVQRWGRFLRHSRENDGSLMKESMKISRRRMELLRKYKVI